MLRAIAAADGVIGINFFAGFLCQEYLDRLTREHGDLLTQLNVVQNFAPEELEERAAERQRTFYNFHVPRPPFERLIQHIDHAVDVAGIDHVGIGGDLDSGPLPLPEGIDSVSDYPKITEALFTRGYDEEDIAKILGGNFMRVFEEVVG
jgi:membrane dipeptidase